ncbi:TusE/DsrC/DsvC family sulfur relay protein [Buchnera aphidicola (Mollitrichosiphum nigrofasciatum)]|uniref:TusE/DsrC/DsvC family sulfur relay protein n=1 Tax=Buchnera aphidicola TaxID=9 RepID=UPI0031B880B7
MKKKYSQIPKDEKGYLKNKTDWNINIAQEIATIEKINLSQDHWEIIYLIKKFYKKYNLVPSNRMLLKKTKKKFKKKNNSLYLLSLFPKGPVKQASKIAGLPKPNKCF